jgi:hypothetical protein
LHKAFVILPLLGWAGVAALVHYAPALSLPEPDKGIVVVVPTVPGEAAHRVPVAQGAHRTLPPAGDRAALVRELQKELTRVGCYDGAISGVWSTASRQAMRAFTERVNARLPTTKPDLVLLSLVQGHRKKACGVACPPGQQEDSAGRCVPDAIARAAKPPAEGEADRAAQTPQIVIGSTAAAAAVAARMRQSEPDASQPSAKAGHAQPSPPAAEKPHAAADKKRARKRRKSARRAKPRPPSPPAVVQNLVSSVKSALGIR